MTSTSFIYILDAFLETIKIFENVDILINNAGILNDAIWEKEILINIVSTNTSFVIFPFFII